MLSPEKRDRGLRAALAALAAVLVATLSWSAIAMPREEWVATECLAVEVYLDGQAAGSVAFENQVRAFAEARGGLRVRVLDIGNEPESRARLATICRYFKREPTTPLVYICGTVIADTLEAKSLRERLQQATTLTVYVRSGCSRCARAKEYLPQLLARFPAFHLSLRDIAEDAGANRDLEQLARQRGVTAVSVPVFDVCGRLIVGFDNAKTTGGRLEEAIRRWTIQCAPDKQSAGREGADLGKHGSPIAAVGLGPLLPAMLLLVGEDLPPLPLPDEPGAFDSGENLPGGPSPVNHEIELPWLGQIDVHRVGLPAFTVAVGLVDGFNPCAMWVLVFLLSVLVNVHSRAKMLLIAGTFVVVSGAIYYAFMAAWLNVFFLVGMLPWIRLTLAALAILIGAIHVKDFFAFKRGISLSIPDSAKPGIYERVRAIVSAENLTGALLGAAALAALVNLVELLCTAGLPALFTQVLAAHNLLAWQYYAFLLLYNAAYMLDDSLMVAFAVVTLGRGRMQESQGRWLKLLSGVVILAFGAVMLVRPAWLGVGV